MKRVSGDGTKFKQIDGENHYVKILPPDDLAKLVDLPVSGPTDPPPSFHRRFVRVAADHLHRDRHLESHLTNTQDANLIFGRIVWCQHACLRNFARRHDAVNFFWTVQLCSAGTNSQSEDLVSDEGVRNPGGLHAPGQNGNKFRNRQSITEDSKANRHITLKASRKRSASWQCGEVSEVCLEHLAPTQTTVALCESRHCIRKSQVVFRAHCRHNVAQSIGQYLRSCQVQQCHPEPKGFPVQ